MEEPSNESNKVPSEFVGLKKISAIVAIIVAAIPISTAITGYILQRQEMELKKMESTHEIMQKYLDVALDSGRSFEDQALVFSLMQKVGDGELKNWVDSIYSSARLEYLKKESKLSMIETAPIEKTEPGEVSKSSQNPKKKKATPDISNKEKQIKEVSDVHYQEHNKTVTESESTFKVETRVLYNYSEIKKGDSIKFIPKLKASQIDFPIYQNHPNFWGNVDRISNGAIIEFDQKVEVLDNFVTKTGYKWLKIKRLSDGQEGWISWENIRSITIKMIN